MTATVTQRSKPHQLVFLCTYYYAAMDYLDEALKGDKFTPMFKTHRAFWQAGIRLMDVHYDEFDIPYENTTIKGFFIGHKHDKSKKPLCVFNNGNDGSILDFWTFGGAVLFARGYNLEPLTAQGRAVRCLKKNLYFRYDWVLLEKILFACMASQVCLL